MQPTVSEKIKKVRNHLGLSQEEFSTRLGLKQGSYSDIERGRNNPSTSVLRLLYNEFNVNPKWFTEGTGDMFITSPVQKIAGKDYGSLAFLKDRNTIRYYESDETGNNMDFIKTETPFKEVMIPGFSDCDVALNAWGDSMDPMICSGEIVLLKQWNESFIEYGHVYLIVTNNFHRMIKILMPGNTEQRITGLSVNSKYPAIEVNLSDIYRLYIVKGHLKRNAI